MSGSRQRSGPRTVKHESPENFDRRRTSMGHQTDRFGIRVCVLDMMCYTPHYDRHLVEALTRLNPSTTLAAIDFPRDPSVTQRAGVHRDPDVVDRVNRWNRTPRVIKPLLKGIEYTINLVRLGRRLPKRDIEIAHLQWSPFAEFLPLDIWFIKHLKKQGIKTVHTVHNLVPHDTGRREARRYRRLYRLPDGLICHTENARKHLVHVHHIPPEKIWLIPHGPMGHEQPRIDRATARQRFGFKEDDVVILLFGNVRPYKGIYDILSAWDSVVENTPNARLVIAGGGDSRELDRIRKMVADGGLEESVLLDLGWIDEDRMVAFHCASDVLAYPYRGITQSGALVSGMRFGRPILATDLPGFRELLDNRQTGLLVPVGDQPALVRALVELIGDPEARRTYGETVRRRWEDRIAGKASWDRVAEQTLECYRTLLGKGP